jgi:hypothetical protein
MLWEVYRVVDREKRRRFPRFDGASDFVRMLVQRWLKGKR